MSAVTEQVSVVRDERREGDITRERGAAAVGATKSSVRQKLRWLVLATTVMVVLGAVALLVSGGMSSPNQQLVFYTVKRGDLQIKVTERGTLESPENMEVLCEVEEIERLIDDINNEILAAQATMGLKSNEKRGAEELFKLGYAGRSEVEQYRLDHLQAEGQFAAKVNKLRTQLATLKKKKTFECQKQVLTLQGAKETAKRNLEQVVRDNEALLEQARAAKEAADEGLRKEEERLARYKMYLDNCKVYAPADGMVAYAVADNRAYWLDEIREGATVRLRQHILSLPNLSAESKVAAKRLSPIANQLQCRPAQPDAIGRRHQAASARRSPRPTTGPRTIQHRDRQRRFGQRAR